jgi:glutamate--cysteine ligase
MLWPLSMPPVLPEKEEAIVLSKLDKFEDVLYRRYLSRAYGRRKQMVSGIHFNFEFSEDFVKKLFAAQAEYTDYVQFKTEIYMKVTRNYLHYRWFYTYLFGATPTSEARYFVEHSGPVEPVRSIRNSQFGYTNHADVQVSYASLTSYLTDIANLVETGKLSEEKEFYSHVRLRGGAKVSDLGKSAIRYIELRNIDINPFAQYGITEQQVDFLNLFLLFMLWTDEGLDADSWVVAGDTMNNLVALEKPFAQTKFQHEGQALLEKMTVMVEQLALNEALPLLEFAKTALQQPGKTLAGEWYERTKASTQKDVAVALGKTNYDAAWATPYQLAGFREMELSTQLLMFDAIQKGITVEVLDSQDQFLKLTAQTHVEYVKNANMTSKDNYVVPLMMANKIVTKKVLANAGFSVPTGAEFNTLAAAEKGFAAFSDQAFVVKPKSTNYGLGISVFKEGASFADYKAALTLAFAEDTAVIVEEFLPGTEYRFFVIDHEVRGILLRVPANVLGDGQHTITELVAQKNTDPLRGTHHRAPLELIQLGAIEQLMLKEQGYTVDDIPAKGATVYLRENSNVSTGGDSIDMTAAFSEDYKAVAVAAVAALGAVICGIDLIIPDKAQPANSPGAYGIIEANFNPAMHMHVYPYQGESRRLTRDVLNLLFPEV